MTATDELRRLLDERGVEWEPSVFDPQHETFYSVENGVGFIVTEFPEIKRMSLACDMRITPEQAIDATLGRGTCHAVFEVDAMSEDDRVGEFVCSECGETFGVGRDQLPHYCPACGKKVVE